MNTKNVQWPKEKIENFCRRWKIRSLEVFGSALREDFRPDSDVDILYTCDEDAPWSMFDLMQMEEELSAILGHKVDLVSREAIERSANWIRRENILRSAETVYESR